MGHFNFTFFPVDLGVVVLKPVVRSDSVFQVRRRLRASSQSKSCNGEVHLQLQKSVWPR